jgi:hypothetical protein
MKTHGAAHGDGSTSGGLWFKMALRPGNEQPLLYAAAGNGVEGVFPGSVSACAVVAARPVSDVAATAPPRATRRRACLIMVVLLGEKWLMRRQLGSRPLRLSCDGVRVTGDAGDR